MVLFPFEKGSTLKEFADVNPFRIMWPNYLCKVLRHIT